MSIRILKKHKQAVLDTLSELAAEGNTDPDVLAMRVAEAVLGAYDEKVRYTVVTSDNIGYGPYATSDAAHKAIAKGLCAFHPGTKAIVIPTQQAPTLRSKAMGSRLVELPGTQLELPLWPSGAQQ